MARKNYEAIAASKIRKPGDSKRAPRLLVYGRSKKGKTHLCSTARNVLLVDPESGSDEEVKANPDVWPLDTWDDVNDCYNFLKTNPTSPITKEKYRWVALDGITKISNIALRWVTNQEEQRNLERKPNDVRIQDHGRAGEMVKGMLHNFHSLRELGIIITAQERMIEVTSLGEEDEDADEVEYMFVPDLPKGARGAVTQIVDVIGRIYIVNGEFERTYKTRAGKTVTKQVEGIQRRLWIGPHASYETGYRSQFVLPNYIPDPTVSRVITAMKEGKV